MGNLPPLTPASALLVRGRRVASLVVVSRHVKLVLGIMALEVFSDSGQVLASTGTE